MKDLLLEVDSLTVTIGKKNIVYNADFSLHANETIALVGESGSGKTTCAHALMRLLSRKKGFSVSGHAIADDKDLLALSEKKFRTLRGKYLSIIFQDPQAALNPVFSIGSQIAEVFDLHGVEDLESATFRVLEEVGLEKITHPFDTYPHELSGGMKQRVMIAMALAMGPRILIADEPTSALDITVQKGILDLLKSYQQAHKMAVLFITHDLSIVSKIADRVLVMYKGVVVEEAKTAELFSNPQHPYTKSLMDARLTKEKRKAILPVNMDHVKKKRSSEKNSYTSYEVSPGHIVRSVETFKEFE